MAATGETGAGHLVLVVEDDRETAAFIASVVRSAGHRAIVAHDVAEGLSLLRAREPCLVLADQELPIAAGESSLIGAGEHLIKEVRAHDTRLAPGTLFYVLQIIAVTGVSEKPDFVSHVHHLGATAFLAKPQGRAFGREEAAALLKKMGDCFGWAKREKHEECGKYARAVASAVSAEARANAGGEAREGEATVVAAAAAAEGETASGPRVVIDGSRTRTRMVMRINGEPREVQESPFASILLAIAAHTRAPGSWSTREALRIPPSRAAMTRIREPFEGLAPAGFHVVQVDRMGGCRLNPGVVVERVEWAVLERHENGVVSRLAKEMRGRR